MPVQYQGLLPERCEICGQPLAGKAFVDGATKAGPWAIMCRDCHKAHGHGLGTGSGQLYDPQGRKIGG